MDSFPTIWCRALGAPALFRYEDRSRPIMRAAKPIAALVYVGSSPTREVSRDTLAQLLWPGVELSEARHSLRQSVYRLRQRAGRDLLLGDGDGRVGLAPDVHIDCLAIEQHLAAGDLEPAFELLDGEFLEGFNADGAVELESWIESQRSRFRATWRRVGQILLERALEESDLTRALHLAEQLAAAFPLEDEPALQLMRVLAAQGRHAAAVSRYRAYCELLHRELDDGPGAELETYAAELEGYLHVGTIRDNGLLPLTGRAAQWVVLEKAWTAAREGRPGTLLIEGAAGLGKSRLLDELRCRVESAGGLALVSKCYEVEQDTPYAPVAEGLAGAMGRLELDALQPVWLHDLAFLLPELGERFPGIESADTRKSGDTLKRRLAVAVRRLLEGIASETPILFAVDDMHWADAASLELIHYLSHALSNSGILLLANYRPADLSPAARQFARSLCASKLADLVLLDPLSRLDVTELLTGLGAFDDERLAEAVIDGLYRHSEGNPLFLVEVLGHLERAGTLSLRAGLWRLGGGARIEDLPRTLGKILSDRLDALESSERVVVETLAVAADRVTVELLAAALHISEPRAELALAVLREERLVRAQRTGEYVLVHDELRRLVYQGLGDDRRRLLHEALGRALEDKGEALRPGGPARLAHHFDRAGNTERTHRYALMAAQEAEWLELPEIQRRQMELADAHAPRALPPGTRAQASTRRRRLRRAAALAATAAAAGSLAFLGGRALREPARVGNGIGDYRQGRLLLSREGTALTHELRWADELGGLASIVALANVEAEKTRWESRWITEGGETHAKLFRVRAGSAVQTTFGATDDYVVGASPDSRYLLVNRGWKADDTRYISNIFVLDTLGHVVWRVTDTSYQNQFGLWSPDGARILVLRDSAGSLNFWISDADGGRSRELSASLGLPTVFGSAGFSPDGQAIAVVYPDTGSNSSAIYVADLTSGTVRPLSATQPRLARSPPVWSPDGRWLAYLAPDGDADGVWVMSADGREGPWLIARASNDARLSDWIDERRRYVASVDIGAADLVVGTGRGRRIVAAARASDGRKLSVPLRWEVGDTGVAAVDSLGFLRGHRPGTTRLVASAGGFRADTSVVRVSSVPLDTLFYEDWSGGLDTSAWRLFGQPRPSVASPFGDAGPQVFSNNGDYNHFSGAASRRGYLIDPAGLTIETSAWVRFTGQDWQDWMLALVTDAEAALSEVPGEWPGAGQAMWVGLQSFNARTPEPTWSAGTMLDRTQGVRPADSLVGRWLRLAIQVRPDTVAEFYADDRLLWRGRVSARQWGEPHAVFLAGRSGNGESYHGAVVVMRGLRY